MPGRFIVVEGTDGVGKTTVAQHLAEITYETAAFRLTLPAVPGSPGASVSQAVFVSRRQVSVTSPYAATLMKHLSSMLWHSGDAPDLSDAFWVSLQAAWFTAHTETVIGPLLDAGLDVIVDGWVHKFFAKLLLQDFTEPEMAVIFNRVRMPDKVLLLNADAAAVYDRRGAFRPAELGMHADYGALDTLGRDTFIDYQNRTAANLRTFADRDGWYTIHLDPGEPLPATVARLAPIIAELRGRPVPAAGSGRPGER